MKKAWKDIKVGDVMKDGSIVTGIHQTHFEECCVVNYGDNQDFTCSYNHILLIDVSKLSPSGKEELNHFCTFVPLEEIYEINCEEELDTDEKLIIDKYFHNEPIDIDVTFLGHLKDRDNYSFNFKAKPKIISLNTVTIKSEPQKVNENTYWLTCKGIKYLLDKYNAELYCNGNKIHSISNIGILPCFCITTNTGRYET